MAKILVYHDLCALKGRIREKKSSYRKLSEITGRSVDTIYRILNGYAIPTADDIDKIADELEITTPEEVVKYFFPHRLRNAI